MGRYLVALLMVSSLVGACSRAGLNVGIDPPAEVRRDDGVVLLPDGPAARDDSAIPPDAALDDLCDPDPCAGNLASCDAATGECICDDACTPQDRCASGVLSVCRDDADGCHDWFAEPTCDAGCFDTTRCAERSTLQWGTAGFDQGNDLDVDPAGDIYVTGHTERSFTQAPNAGSGDVFLTRLFADGTQDWSRQWGSGAYEQGTAIAIDPGSAVYVVGRTFGGLDGQANVGDGDGFVTRFSTDGVHAWTRHLGTAQRDAALDVAVAAGAVYIVGTTEGDLDGQPNSGGLCIVGACPDGINCTTRACTDAYLTRLQADGTPAWTRVFGTDGSDVASAVTIAPDGGVIVAGHSGGDFAGIANRGGPCAPRPCNDLFATRFEPDGSRGWTQVWGSDDHDLTAAVTADDDGAVYVAGMSAGDLADANRGLEDGIVTRLSSDGQLDWIRQWGSDDDDDIEDVRILANGDLIVVGQTHGDLDGRTAPPHHWDAFMTRWDVDGGQPESTQWGSAGGAFDFRPPSGVNAVFESAEGNLLLFGYTLGGLDGNANAGTDCANMLGCSDLFLSTLKSSPPP